MLTTKNIYQCDTKNGLPYHAFAYTPRLYKNCNHIAKENKMHKKKHVTKICGNPIILTKNSSMYAN
jgi:hypothetical protein